MPTIKNILIPADFSDCSKAAFDYAVYLTKCLEAELHLLHVFEPPCYPPVGKDLQIPLAVREWITGLKEGASKNLNTLTEAAQRLDIEVHPIFKEGEPFEEILKIADEINANLIVLGSHGRKGLDKFLMGSVAESVLRKASCPVFLVREKERSAGGAER